MKRLCFGTLFRVMTLCTSKKVNNRTLCHELLLSVSPGRYFDCDDSTASHFRSCTRGRGLPPEFIEAAINADAEDVAVYIQKKVLPLLVDNKKKLMVLAFKDIIASDETIDETTLLGKQSGYKKATILEHKEVALLEFFANLLIYTISKFENEVGADCANDIDKTYLLSFEEHKNDVCFDFRPLQKALPIKQTLDNDTFERIFKEIPHTASLRLNNPNCLRFFCLRVSNGRFDYTNMKEFLFDNIGRYVLSRAELDRMKIESINLRSVRRMNKQGSPGEKGTGNELGEVLVYAFLERVLNAPKIMSKVELVSRRSQYNSKSDGIHLLVLDNNGKPNYQIVSPASSMLGGLQSAVDSAFDTVVDILDNSEGEMYFVESAAYMSLFSNDVVNEMIKILVPSRVSSWEDRDISFGVFLGYSFSMDKTQSSNIIIRNAIEQQIESDIRAAAPYIAEKISKIGLENYSFYFYVLPFNDAEQDKKEIMEDLLWVGGSRHV